MADGSESGEEYAPYPDVDAALYGDARDFDGEYEVESNSDSEVIEIDIDKNLGPDYKYAGQFGYSFYAMLRGDNPGRHLKRDVFNFGMVQLICGIAFLVIMDKSVDIEPVTKFLHHSANCNNFRGLQWFLGIINLPFAAFSLFIVRNWATFTTNRQLVAHTLRIYCMIFTFIFIFSLWCVISMFMGFKNANFSATDDVGNLYSIYVSSAVFLLLYNAAIIAAVLDIWAYTDDILYRGGDIKEPNGPGPVADLSELTLSDGCLFIVALPLGACLQLIDLCSAIARFLLRCVGAGSSAGRRSFVVKRTTHTGEVIETTITRKQKGFCVRLFSTICRICSCTPKQSHHSSHAVTPDSDVNASAQHRLSQKLAQLRQKRYKSEEADIDNNEFADIENQVAEEFAADDAQSLKSHKSSRQVKDGDTENPVADNEPVIPMTQQEAEQEETTPATLTVTQFKGMWSTMESSGSFQCHLRQEPTMHALVEHMRKQGFHIVFASTSPTKNPSPTDPDASTSNPNPSTDSSAIPRVDLEIGICNIRESATSAQPWFLARFIISNLIFSAVMKCEDSEAVRIYVKKFSLAKILKIVATKQ